MRTAVAVSVLAHAVFCALNMLSAPAPIANPAEKAITADIVSADELGEAAKAPAPEKALTPEASAAGTEAPLGASASESTPPRPSPPTPQQRQTRQSQQATEPKATPAQARVAAATQLPAQPAATPGTAASGVPNEPSEEHQADLPQLGSSWLDAALSSLPVTASRYDESETVANLSQQEIAAFKAHLQKCWSPPAGLADDGQLMAVLRVGLKPNGSLAGEPTMLAASASSNGPALLQTAMRALRQCQPYGFLPSAKYKEWKVLDLSFSSSGLSTRPALVSGFDNH